MLGTLGDLAARVSGRVVGDGSVRIARIAGVEEADAGAGKAAEPTAVDIEVEESESEDEAFLEEEEEDSDDVSNLIDGEISPDEEP